MRSNLDELLGAPLFIIDDVQYTPRRTRVILSQGEGVVITVEDDPNYADPNGDVMGAKIVTIRTTGVVSDTVISPAQLTANTDNWAPDNLSFCTVIRAASDASRNLTGIVACLAPNHRKRLINTGAQNIVLKHATTSTASNQFLCPGSADFTLTPNMGVDLWYDGTQSRWRVIT